MDPIAVTANPAWLIADSRAALAHAHAQCVAADVPVLSAAPPLLYDPELGARAIDGHVTHEQVLALFDATLALAADIYDTLMNEGFADAALSVARSSLWMQATLYRAMQLDEDLFHREIVVAEFETGRPEFDTVLRSPLPQLLAANPRAAVTTVSVADDMAGFEAAPPAPDFWQRLAASNPANIAYRLVIHAAQRLPRVWPHGEFWVLRETELLKEAGVWLAARGYAIRLIPRPDASSPAPEAADMGARLRGILAPLFDRHVGPLLAPSALAPARGLFLDRALNVQGQFAAGLAHWRRLLAGKGAQRCRGVLSNALATPQATALFHACRERSIPFVMFQHGVTHEICRRVASLEPFLEINAADYCITFNRESARVQEGSRYRQGRALVAGLPRDYYRHGTVARRDREAPPIWYVSTCLYLGNYSLLNLGVSDLEKARAEIRLLDEVFGRLPHRLLYKPYPGERYIDPDPVAAHAETFANIEVYRERLDLRYLGRAARVIVTGRASGTAGWCLMLGKPMVFIDYPEQAPLRADVRDAFAAGIFTFDAGKLGWEAELRAFLSQPMEEIERQWAERAEARRRFIAEYVDDAMGGPSGRRAARAVLDAVRDYAKRRETAA